MPKWTFYAAPSTASPFHAIPYWALRDNLPLGKYKWVQGWFFYNNEGPYPLGGIDPIPNHSDDYRPCRGMDNIFGVQSIEHMGFYNLAGLNAGPTTHTATLCLLPRFNATTRRMTIHRYRVAGNPELTAGVDTPAGFLTYFWAICI